MRRIISPGLISAAVAALALAMLAAACGPKQAPTTTPAAPPQAAPAQAPAPPPLTPRPPAPPPLLGHVTRGSIHEYAPWKTVWDRPPYAPDPAAVTAIKAGADRVTVLVIMATWCPDTKRELPRYFATMDAAAISDAVLTMVGVDRTKKDTEGLTNQYGITLVPTFVFFRDGKEIGRLVERTPAGSTFEAEVARILSAK
jgi:thiol-disulfide isomerase/thioredoxin